MFHKRQTVHELYFFPKQLKVQLDSIRQYPLTIVEAPSGFGKTTAIQKYLEKISGPASSVYWYTCLNEPPSGIWNGICSLFAKIDGKTAVNLNRLNLPDADALADLSSMIREVRCPSETFLVIDSFQLMKSRIPDPSCLFCSWQCQSAHYLHLPTAPGPSGSHRLSCQYPHH